MIPDLLSGECDIGVQDGDFESFLPLLVQAEQDGLLDIVAAPANGWEHIDFGIVPVSSYRNNDFFGDVRVRQAIVQCIDRQAIVDEMTFGLATVTNSYLPPSHPLYPRGDLMRWGYNPSTGRTLLEEVGWVDEDESGVREAQRIDGVRTGTPFEIALLIPSDNAVAQGVARIVKANLADCGIRVDLESSQEFFADGPDGPFFGRQFDLAETTWWFDLHPPCVHYLSSEVPERGDWDGDNPSGYSNPDYDAACQGGLQALPGTPEYEEYHQQAQVIFSEELPAIPLFTRLRIAVTRPDVLNFMLDSTAQSELWNIEELDIQQDTRDLP
jgi:peptide/nickel transport system substrate-binding protein